MMLDSRKLYFRIFLVLTIVYIFFQIKPGTSVAGNVYAGDDQSYYGYINSIVNDFDLDFSNNDTGVHYGVSSLTGRIILPHPIGVSIMLMPFYIAAKPFVCLYHLITDSPFDQRNILFFMFICAGVVLYCYLGGYILFRAMLLLGIDDKISLVSVVLIVWGTILPVYIFRRPMLSHIPEFFLISCLVYFLVKYKDDYAFDLRKVLILSIISGAIIITRWYAVNIMFLVIFYILVHSKKMNSIKSKILNIFVFISVVFIIFFFTQGMVWKMTLGGYFSLPYDPLTMKEARPMTELLSFKSVRNLFHVFIGSDWGLVYTMLPFVSGLAGFLIFNPLRISRRKAIDRVAYILFLALPFIIVVKLGLQGCYYGYRNLLILLPFSSLGLAFFLSRMVEKFSLNQKKIWIFVAVIITLNFFLILPFERSEATSLKLGTSIMGGTSWVNNSYIIDAVKFYFGLSIRNIVGLFARNFLGQYVLGGLYLWFPDIFSKIVSIYPDVGYYALDSFDKRVILIYPFFVVGLLSAFNTFFVNRTIPKNR